MGLGSAGLGFYRRESALVCHCQDRERDAQPGLQEGALLAHGLFRYHSYGPHFEQVKISSTIDRILIYDLSRSHRLTIPYFSLTNRFSRDVDTLDNVLWSTLYEFLITVVTLLGTVALIIVVFPWLLLAIVPLMGLYYALSTYYRATSREVKRLDSNMRSHLYAYFSECLTGLGTLKAYNVVDKAVAKNEYRIDLNNRPYYLFQVGARWVSIRVNVLGALLTFSVVILVVATRQSINPASVGLVLSYLARISGDLNWGVQRLSTLVSLILCHHLTFLHMQSGYLFKFLA